MAEQETHNPAKARLKKRAIHFSITLLIGILFGYKTAQAYGITTPFYITALSALGTLCLWSFSLVAVSIIEANRELNAAVPSLEKMQDKLLRLQESGKVPVMPRDDRV